MASSTEKHGAYLGQDVYSFSVSILEIEERRNRFSHSNCNTHG